MFNCHADNCLFLSLRQWGRINLQKLSFQTCMFDRWLSLGCHQDILRKPWWAIVQQSVWAESSISSMNIDISSSILALRFVPGKSNRGMSQALQASITIVISGSSRHTNGEVFSSCWIEAYFGSPVYTRPSLPHLLSLIKFTVLNISMFWFTS